MDEELLKFLGFIEDEDDDQGLRIESIPVEEE